MTFSKNRLVGFLFALVFAFTLVGCGEGTETAGQKIDEAAQKTGESMDKAAEHGKEMMDETKEKIKEAGQ